MKAGRRTKESLQSLASSNARMSCPGAAQDDVVLTIKEIGYEYLVLR
jgi:hypothetical protein